MQLDLQRISIKELVSVANQLIASQSAVILAHLRLVSKSEHDPNIV